MPSFFSDSVAELGFLLVVVNAGDAQAPDRTRKFDSEGTAGHFHGAHVNTRLFVNL
jgi:hypothetical protein